MIDALAKALISENLYLAMFLFAVANSGIRVSCLKLTQVAHSEVPDLSQSHINHRTKTFCALKLHNFLCFQSCEAKKLRSEVLAEPRAVKIPL